MYTDVANTREEDGLLLAARVSAHSECHSCEVYSHPWRKTLVIISYLADIFQAKWQYLYIVEKFILQVKFISMFSSCISFSKLFSLSTEKIISYKEFEL